MCAGRAEVITQDIGVTIRPYHTKQKIAVKSYIKSPQVVTSSMRRP